MAKKVKSEKLQVKGQILPAPGYLLIEPDSVETKTASGLYLPDNATQEKPQQGKVIAVGDKDGKKEPTAKVGDKVIYKKWGGNEYKQDNNEYSFIKFEDIMGVIK